MYTTLSPKPKDNGLNTNYNLLRFILLFTITEIQRKCTVKHNALTTYNNVRATCFGLSEPSSDKFITNV
jgi:hypothetical protein